MRVKIDDLKIGAVIAEDVMGMTSTPIIPKKTVVTGEHVEVLKAFLKKEVNVEGSATKREKIQIKAVEAKTKIKENESITLQFQQYFEETIQKYKLDFLKWQSGSAIDIANVRDYLYSLLEKAELETEIPPSLYLYNNESEYIYIHSISVGIISGLIAKKMGYGKGQYYQAALAGCLANAGMAKISHKIISKKNPLSSEEKLEIHEHPNHSLKMVQNSPLLKSETKLAIFQHHERLDGTGYPMGVKGNQLYPISRITAVADVFHALVSNRYYKQKLAPFKALELIRIDGFGKYDLSVINSLMSLIVNLSIGTKVMLSSGESGEVIFIKQSSPTRPLIKLNGEEIIDLEKARDIHIKEVY
ncbi:HD family phosphohydrolase [Heyndrickxia sporothermodurans]|nr:HD family phosphohydrolase [Heyndrickxia sporothermodurans]